MSIPTFPDCLHDRGARRGDDGHADFGDRRAEFEAAANGAIVAPAADLALLAIEGADAEAFLQGQLSNDVKALAPGAGQWTSYNSPKGRMLATLFLFRAGPEAFGAILAADLAAAIARRLSMFVLRSKVAVRDASPQWSLLGLGGPRAGEALRAAFGDAPGPGSTMESGGRRVIGLPDGRFVVAVAAADACAAFDALAAHATPAGSAAWSWAGVASGVPMVTTATQDQFVPQTANWDAVGGLDFRKGCYPGQEIVARTQYLGRLKERLHRFGFDGPAPVAGTRLFGEPFGDQACGTVVNAAPAPSGAQFLAVVQQAAADAGPLAIGSPEGPRATLLPLPYAVPVTAPRPRP